MDENNENCDITYKLSCEFFEFLMNKSQEWLKNKSFYNKNLLLIVASLGAKGAFTAMLCNMLSEVREDKIEFFLDKNLDNLREDILQTLKTAKTNYE